ncbi:uncharacterized protein LOC109846914 [Asparagus officinalis]|uniref:uncharacterized protein LOC109846914 n=1 Tax=Asparagus officinalis TaxID=4686 RepID=UPI00098E2B4A|nr:uncharacterized protein LOC109846914 [Asparagus officinalis]
MVLSKGSGSLFSNPTKYHQVVDALQYVMLTRPDLAFAVNKVCQFMHQPTDDHWMVVKQILHYLRSTSSHGLFIRRDSPFLLEAYYDSDCARCLDDRHSTCGFSMFLGNNLISSTSRKQRTVSQSSTEFEYKALADTAAELTWIQSLFRKLGISLRSIPTLWRDNLVDTYLSANPVFHARTKHVEINFQFVQEKVARHDLQVQFISTHDQLADILTKALSSQRFDCLRSKLQVVSRP